MQINTPTQRSTGKPLNSTDPQIMIPNPIKIVIEPCIKFIQLSYKIFLYTKYSDFPAYHLSVPSIFPIVAP